MQLSVKDAARLLKVPENTVYRWIKDGSLPAYHIDGVYRFSRAELLEWAISRQMEIASEAFLDGSGEQDGTDEGREETRPKGPEATLADALAAGEVLHGVEGGDKNAVLRAIIDAMRLPEEVDREFLFQVLLAREKLGSTGIGGGIAIPHVRNPLILDIGRPAVTVCFLKKPMDFKAPDGQPVHTLFLLAAPNIRAHLRLLARLGFVLRDAGVKAALERQAQRPELLAEIARAEAGLASAEPAAGGEA